MRSRYHTTVCFRSRRPHRPVGLERWPVRLGTLARSVGNVGLVAAVQPLQMTALGLPSVVPPPPSPLPLLPTRRRGRTPPPATWRGLLQHRQRRRTPHLQRRGKLASTGRWGTGVARSEMPWPPFVGGEGGGHTPLVSATRGWLAADVRRSYKWLPSSVRPPVVPARPYVARRMSARPLRPPPHSEVRIHQR